jgi:hypothetical protein
MPHKPGPKVDPALGPLKRETVTLDAHTVRMARALGSSLSDGLRKAVRVAYRAYQREDEVADRVNTLAAQLRASDARYVTLVQEIANGKALQMPQVLLQLPPDALLFHPDDPQLHYVPDGTHVILTRTLTPSTVTTPRAADMSASVPAA